MAARPIVLLLLSIIYGCNAMDRVDDKGPQIRPLESLSNEELAGISLLRVGACLHLLVLNCRAMDPGTAAQAMEQFSYEDFIEHKNVPRIHGVTDLPGLTRYAAPWDARLYLQPGQLMNAYRKNGGGCAALYTAFWARYKKLEKEEELREQQKNEQRRRALLESIRASTEGQR